MPQSTPASPDQIARNGHAAAVLRAYFKRTGETRANFNTKMGLKRSNTGVYQWLNGKNGISPKKARKVSKITGIPMEDLTQRALNTAKVNPNRVSEAGALAIREPLRREVLSFAVLQDGEARIKLDISLPLKSATPLLRLLLDAGLVL
jgi:hypothetical protein